MLLNIGYHLSPVMAFVADTDAGHLLVLAQFCEVACEVHHFFGNAADVDTGSSYSPLGSDG